MKRRADLFPALVAIAALAAAGCGFLNEGTTDGRRLSDGVSPWTDLGALQVCIGGSRVLDSTNREGLCRADGQVPESCDADEDCRGDESCVCGRCTVRLCDATDECRAGQICGGNPRRCTQRCENDTECGPYGVCNGGTCEKACWSQDDCPVGELCLVGRCAAVRCGVNGPNCFPGETCEIQNMVATLGGPQAVEAPPGDDARVVLFTELSSASEPSAIMRLESADGVHFTAVPATPVLTPMGGQTRVSRPTIVETAGGLVMFVEIDDGASIGRSLDPTGAGTSFPMATPVLLPGTWEAGAVHSPSATLVDGSIVLAYEGGDGLGIGLSIEDSMGGFSAAAAPVLQPSDYDASDRWEGVTRIGAPDINYAITPAGRPLLQVFATGFGLVVPAEVGGPLDVPTDSIAYAATVYDALTPTPTFDLQSANPTFSRVVNFTPLDESESSRVAFGESWLLYYTDGSALRVAVNPMVVED